ncbi:bifunctional riboflavin kinase/FAD synthetase, partial [Francisella tularensis subsp. holarctica]|nr:bifunctional riboflavin kinase/FAD synthetase [Francisella tularensis subsp. holarctica]
MKIITNLNKTKDPIPKAIDIGSFDCVQLWHNEIIKKLLT